MALKYEKRFLDVKERRIYRRPSLSPNSKVFFFNFFFLTSSPLSCLGVDECVPTPHTYNTPLVKYKSKI